MKKLLVLLTIIILSAFSAKADHYWVDLGGCHLSDQCNFIVSIDRMLLCVVDITEQNDQPIVVETIPGHDVCEMGPNCFLITGAPGGHINWTFTTGPGFHYDSQPDLAFTSDDDGSTHVGYLDLNGQLTVCFEVTRVTVPAGTKHGDYHLTCTCTAGMEADY